MVGLSLNSPVTRIKMVVSCLSVNQGPVSFSVCRRPAYHTDISMMFLIIFTLYVNDLSFQAEGMLVELLTAKHVNVAQDYVPHF